MSEVGSNSPDDAIATFFCIFNLMVFNIRQDYVFVKIVMGNGAVGCLVKYRGMNYPLVSEKISNLLLFPGSSCFDFAVIVNQFRAILMVSSAEVKCLIFDLRIAIDFAVRSDERKVLVGNTLVQEIADENTSITIKKRSIEPSC